MPQLMLTALYSMDDVEWLWSELSVWPNPAHLHDVIIVIQWTLKYKVDPKKSWAISATFFFNASRLKFFVVLRIDWVNGIFPFLAILQNLSLTQHLLRFKWTSHSAIILWLIVESYPFWACLFWTAQCNQVTLSLLSAREFLGYLEWFRLKGLNRPKRYQN